MHRKPALVDPAWRRTRDLNADQVADRVPDTDPTPNARGAPAAEDEYDRTALRTSRPRAGGLCP
ncbi:hypothetical protein BFW01_g5812 [Lasiodiplodia theobromae]|nr:hypothetical protein BFW01_g5812 [Lasiodiplodia theobromae]